MSLTQNKKKLLTRIIVVIVSMAFIMCAAIFALGYNGVGLAANPYAEAPGLRFVQVAAGEDFAIGLTYDGELYGWSLLPTPNNAAPSTLGNYYTTTPAQIDFSYSVGPVDNGGVIAKWGDGEAYHGSTNADNKIVQIAATRTTAAFVTQNGYIYTWGVDSEPVEYTNDGSNGLSIKNRLLLREYENETYKVQQYVPHIINYGYYDNGTTTNDALRYIRPTYTTGGSMANLSLAAGEYDYILVFSRDNTYYSFVWGSSLYNVTNREGVTSLQMNMNSNGALWDGGAAYRMPYKTNGTTAVAVAGGYTVGINYDSPSQTGGTSLSLHGKNFITSGKATLTAGDPVGVYKVMQTTQTVEGEATRVVVPYTQNNVGGANITQINNALAGGYTASTSAGAVVDATVPFYATQKAPDNNGLTYTNSNTDKMARRVMDAQGVPLNLDKGSNVIRSAVSLGNDIGYAVDNNGNIYAWGDNSIGQSGMGTGTVSYSVPTPITAGVLNGKKIISVAAGKQLSNTAARALNSTQTFTVGENSAITFSSQVTNTANFITGAIDDNGNLYVWSNGNPTPTQIYFGNQRRTTNPSRFIAVYSGYGNNLFAITAQGKVVRIEHENAASTRDNKIACDGGYLQTVYDNFASITNWTVADAAANTVYFRALVTDNDPEPNLGKATFYLHSAERSQNTIFSQPNAELPENIVDYTASDYVPAEGETNANVLSYAGTKESLITSNVIGDTYRLLDSTYKSNGTKVDDANIKFLFVPATLADNAQPIDIEPKFFIGTTELTPAQRDNMFSYEFVYSAENGVGFEITPKQSSKGATVRVQLVAARYDCSTNFNITANSRPDDNGIYYDYKTVQFQFVIDNTPAYMNNNAFRGRVGEDGFGDGQSYLPLLDPNNEFNKVYSLAIQDVSTGFEELVRYLFGLNAGASVSGNDLYKNIISKISTADSGFPAASKIDDGNLNYYLGAAEASRAYSGVYQYLIKDRDADYVTVPVGTNIIRLSGNKSSSVPTTRETIQITVPIEPTSVNDNVKARIAAINTDFNNKYGLYHIEFGKNEDGNFNSITFWYDVLRITANGATFNNANSINYNNALDADGGRHATGVTDYSTSTSYNNGGDSTTNTGNSVMVTFTTNEFPNVNSNVISVPTTGAQTAQRLNAIAIFSQPSVRLSTADVYGDHSAANNTYDLTLSATATVGQETKVELKNYVTCKDGIFFAFNDSTNEYAAFNKQFLDDNHKQIFTLTNDTLTFKPSSTADQFVTIYIQRFNQLNKTFGREGEGGYVDEKIEFNITFKNITPVTITKVENPRTSFNISVPTEIDVLGNDFNAALVNFNGSESAKSGISIDGLKATKDGKIVSAARVAGSNTKILVTPLSSGSARVLFTVNLNGASIPFMLDFNVAGRTTWSETISLTETDYLTVSRLKTELRNQNGGDSNINNYNILYGDVDENGYYNAITFYDKDNNLVYSDYNGKTVNKPGFISPVTFTNLGANNQELSNTNIRLAVSDSSQHTDGVYYMRVKFVDTLRFASYSTYKQFEDDPAAAVLEVEIPITSARKYLVKNNADGSSESFVLNIDCDTPVDNDPTAAFKEWYTQAIDMDKPGVNDNMRVYIPLSYLLSMVQEDGINIDQYRVSLVQAPSSSANLFNAYAQQGGQFLVIDPSYDTVDSKGNQEPVTINVTVMTEADVSANQVMILSFKVTVSGISTTLPKDTYTLIWIVAASVSAAVVLIIFLVMLIVYFARRAKQRTIIKRNKELIKMRDRIHNKNSATREQLVKSKLKMEDPKFAAKYNSLKNAQRDSMGVAVEGVDDFMDDGKKKKKKKKNGKKSIAELKAELEAKRAALGQQPDAVDPFANAVDVNAQSYGVEPTFGGDQGFGEPAYGGDQGFAGGFGEPVFGDQGFGGGDMGDNTIVFDAGDMGDGSQG